ncbi:MAG: hypothetical protein HYX41_02500 [Bdellovibrio sp.]|nr:hypothetical protein [Bdellovibrio sp.]
MRYEIVIDAGETPNKCTIAPLASRADFKLIRVRGAVGLLGPFEVPYLLHPDGTCLTELVKNEAHLPSGIAAIDCVWNRLDYLISKVAAPLPRLASLPKGFVTAYPRKSAQNTDPEQGLATIEAIFIGAALMGNWDPSLFSQYYFGLKFLELNQKLFLELGVKQAAELSAFPAMPPKNRNSAQRRRDRGRFRS